MAVPVLPCYNPYRRTKIQLQVQGGNLKLWVCFKQKVAKLDI